MSVTHGTRKTPWLALVLGAVIGILLALLLRWAGGQDSEFAATVSGALLNMAVFGAVISYAMQCVAFVLLRRNMPGINRPFRSPWGVPGAVVAGIISVVALIATFLNEDYRPGVYGVAIWFVLAIAYFGLAGRHKLVLSPEEEFALTNSTQAKV
jgi:ethanolamine permease